jgi:hypothetical protein
MKLEEVHELQSGEDQLEMSAYDFIDVISIFERRGRYQGIFIGYALVYLGYLLHQYVL